MLRRNLGGKKSYTFMPPFLCRARPCLHMFLSNECVLPCCAKKHTPPRTVFLKPGLFLSLLPTSISGPSFLRCRYQAWVDHLNSVIDTAPLGARLDVPLLRRADADPRALPPQQKQPAPGGLVGGWVGGRITAGARRILLYDRGSIFFF